MLVFWSWREIVIDFTRVVYHGVTSRFFMYRYFAGIRFTWRSVFLVGITNLAGTPFFRERGAGCIKKGAGAPFFLKKGASAPFLREKGVPTKKMIPKCTDRDFLQYRYGKYQEIPTDIDRKIPIRYTTLDFTYVFSVQYSCGVVNITGNNYDRKKRYSRLAMLEYVSKYKH